MTAADYLPGTLHYLIAEALKMSGPGVMEGWTDPARGLEMAELVLSLKPETITEIGSFGARSTIAMAMALRSNGHGKIYTIDPWKKEPAIEGEQNTENTKWWSALDLHDIHRKAMEAIWKHELDDWVVVLRARSQDVPRLFVGGIDLLVIDGCHSEISSCRDVELYCPMLKEGAHLWFDDADWPSTQKALGMIETCCSLVRDAGSYRVYRRK